MSSTKHYQAIIFDLDDTLVAAGPIKWAHHKAVAKEYFGRDLPDETLARYWGMPFDPMIELLHNHAATAKQLRPAYAATRSRFPKQPFPDAIITVQSFLKSGYYVGVLSAMNRDEVKDDLQQLGLPLTDFFLVQGAEDTTVHKPDPAVFAPALALLARRDIKAENVLYVGDALTDWAAASSAGLGFIGVTTGFTPAEDFARNNVPNLPTISKVAELLLDAIGT
jgi:phosphoglycolate phosphatase-like HAD superfamily hydrolase